MKVLLIGGSGIISAACSRLTIERGHEVAILNRGRRGSIEGARQIVADVGDVAAAKAALGDERWDAVVDFVSFVPSDIERRIELLGGRARQYVFISSASAYQKPLRNYLITESTPLANPFWQYSRDKIACEERLLAELRSGDFPAVIVRPSLTYGDGVVPLAVNSWQKSYTAIDRLRRGQPLIVPGDGSSLWTITHSSDFAKGLVGLLGNEDAVGHAFHITSDEALTWDQIYLATARVAGVERPELVHIASDFITACAPDLLGTLTGDKSCSAVFDNSKIKRFVPDFVATTRYADGIRQTVAAFDRDPSLRDVDGEANRFYDQLIEAYRDGLDAARRSFGR